MKPLHLPYSHCPQLPEELGLGGEEAKWLFSFECLLMPLLRPASPALHCGSRVSAPLASRVTLTEPGQCPPWSVTQRFVARR